jgi:hypothetical protein
VRAFSGLLSPSLPATKGRMLRGWRAPIGGFITFIPLTLVLGPVVYT